jgi:hypothetical protein
MSKKIHEVQGYAVVVSKIVFLTRVFKAENNEGFQFNIGLSGGARVSPQFAARHEADLEREMILKTIRES